MAAGTLNGFLDRLARGMAAEAHADRTDAELVRRLRAGADPAGFAAVVRRHGPMVCRVCRRVLRHAGRRRGRLPGHVPRPRPEPAGRPPRPSPGGLAARGRRADRPAGPGPRRGSPPGRAAGPAAGFVPPDDLSWAELRSALDEELARLPERWRVPLVLCHLEGRTQDEAARQLGWPRITLRRRLDEAPGRARPPAGPPRVRPGRRGRRPRRRLPDPGGRPARLLDHATTFITAAGRAAAPARVPTWLKP